MGHPPFFDNACTVMGLTRDQKEKLSRINVALGVNADDGVHIYMIVGEVVTEALRSHRLLTTTFLTNFDRDAKGSESRMKEVLATSAVQNAERNAALVTAAIETTMQEFAEKQRRRISFRSAALVLIAVVFMTCAGWAFGDFRGSWSSGFLREVETRGEAAALQSLVDWNAGFLKTFANCGPDSGSYRTFESRGYCQFNLYVEGPLDRKSSDIESFIATVTPHIRSVWPWSGVLVAFVFGLLTQTFWRACRTRVTKYLFRWSKGFSAKD